MGFVPVGVTPGVALRHLRCVKIEVPAIGGAPLVDEVEPGDGPEERAAPVVGLQPVDAGEADAASDRAEWAAVYVLHSARLVRLATVLVGPDDASDLVVDAVRRAVHAGNWRTVGDQGAYLARTVVNAARQFERANARRRRREARAQRLTLSVPAADADLDVRRALDALSPQQRAVIHLHYWEDRSIPDVAIALDVSEGTVRKQLARAKAKLAEELR